MHLPLTQSLKNKNINKSIDYPTGLDEINWGFFLLLLLGGLILGVIFVIVALWSEGLL